MIILAVNYNGKHGSAFDEWYVSESYHEAYQQWKDYNEDPEVNHCIMGFVVHSFDSRHEFEGSSLTELERKNIIHRMLREEAVAELEGKD